MTITPIYAGLATLIFVALSFRVIRARRGAGVALGDGGDSHLRRCQRVHGNFAEYVPLALLLMALAELQGTSGWLINAIGLALIAGRLIHAYGVSQEPETIPIRVAGMSLTFVALITGALTNLGLGGFAALAAG
ncbi:MAG: MAPEG family protein [Pseudomonadota bacterium]